MNSTNVKSVDIERPAAATDQRQPCPDPDSGPGSAAACAQLVVHLQNWSLRPALCWCTVHLSSVQCMPMPVCVCPADARQIACGGEFQQQQQ